MFISLPRTYEGCNQILLILQQLDWIVNFSSKIEHFLIQNSNRFYVGRENQGRRSFAT